MAIVGISAIIILRNAFPIGGSMWSIENYILSYVYWIIYIFRFLSNSFKL